MERRDKAALNHSGLISCPLLMSLGVICAAMETLDGCVCVCAYVSVCVYRYMCVCIESFPAPADC